MSSHQHVDFSFDVLPLHIRYYLIQQQLRHKFDMLYFLNECIVLVLNRSLLCHIAAVAFKTHQNKSGKIIQCHNVSACIHQQTKDSNEEVVSIETCKTSVKVKSEWSPLQSTLCLLYL